MAKHKPLKTNYHVPSLSKYKKLSVLKKKSMAQTSKTLQVGITEFSKFQTRNFVYVDKTDLIGVLATQYSDQVLLTRPRRFGKTLLTNTLRTLFQEGFKQFKGLKIEKLWHEQTYDVVQLDFSKSPSSFKTIEEFRERFWNYIQSQFSSIGSLLSKNHSQLGFWIARQYVVGTKLMIKKWPQVYS